MTKEEILAMKAGRELDALVAEVIFGYRVHRYASRDWQVYCPGLHKSARRMCKYSQTASAAWLVVEKVAYPPIMFTLQMGFYPAPWAIAHFGGFVAGGNTAPEAICKAGLLAQYS